MLTLSPEIHPLKYAGAPDPPPPPPDSRALKRLLIVACDASACETPSRCVVIHVSWSVFLLSTALRRSFCVELTDSMLVMSVSASDSRVFKFWLSRDRKSTRLNSSHVKISYAVFCLKKKIKKNKKFYSIFNI